VCDHVEKLLSAYLDGELTQAEGQLVRVHLEDCADCRKRYETMRSVQRVASDMKFIDPPEKKMQEIEERVSVRAPRRAGWGLLLAGVVAWALYASYLFITNPDLPSWEKLMTGAVLIGLALLLISVLRERLLSLKHDRYRSVKK
jgi:predicted anti-sigma-YlaC factor YlaD